VIDAEDTVLGCAGASAAVVRTLSPHVARMREGASGFLLATEVADYLVGRGVPFRTAHEVTGRIVRDLADRHLEFSSLTLADWQRYDPRFDRDVVDVITPEAAVRARRTPQSTNPEAVRRALEETRDWLLKDRLPRTARPE
jgi:argininosuccinate lyase